jgi:hypothetical protein
MDTAQLTLVRQPFDHPDSLFELKHDGFRALAYIHEGQRELKVGAKPVPKSAKLGTRTEDAFYSVGGSNDTRGRGLNKFPLFIPCFN